MPLLFRAVAAISVAALVSSCAASSKTFYSNPSRVGDTALCRAAFETTDERFRRDAATELNRRGLSVQACEDKIGRENAGLITVGAVMGLIALGVACANRYCPSAPSAPSQSRGGDYDCKGGPGDGPLYVQGPVPVPYNDPYDLDRDGDGIGCEPYQDYGA